MTKRAPLQALRAAIHVAFVAAFVVAVGGGCVTDVKGDNCGLLDAFTDSNGDNFCPDKDAPKDCETLKDAFVATAQQCADDAGLPVNHDDLQAAADDNLPCDNAVATKPEFDDCTKAVDDAQCNADGTFPLPDVCKGVILTHG